MKNHEAPLVECLRQRVQDSDFGLNKMTVRNRKGAKDRVTVLSQVVKGPLLEQLKRVRAFTSYHTFRHLFTTHVLEGGHDIRTLQELLGHKDVNTTMVYTHVVNLGGRGVRSSVDSL